MYGTAGRAGAGPAPIVPDVFICGLTKSFIMRDPVMDPTSLDRACERAILEKYVRKHGKSPLTGKPLTVEQLWPNKPLRDIIHSQYWDRVGPLPDVSIVPAELRHPVPTAAPAVSAATAQGAEAAAPAASVRAAPPTPQTGVAAAAAGAEAERPATARETAEAAAEANAEGHGEADAEASTSAGSVMQEPAQRAGSLPARASAGAVHSMSAEVPAGQARADVGIALGPTGTSPCPDDGQRRGQPSAAATAAAPRPPSTRGISDAAAAVGVAQQQGQATSNQMYPGTNGATAGGGPGPSRGRSMGSQRVAGAAAQEQAPEPEPPRSASPGGAGPQVADPQNLRQPTAAVHPDALAAAAAAAAAAAGPAGGAGPSRAAGHDAAPQHVQKRVFAKTEPMPSQVQVQGAWQEEEEEPEEEDSDSGELPPASKRARLSDQQDSGAAGAAGVGTGGAAGAMPHADVDFIDLVSDDEAEDGRSDGAGATNTDAAAMDAAGAAVGGAEEAAPAVRFANLANGGEAGGEAPLPPSAAPPAAAAGADQRMGEAGVGPAGESAHPQCPTAWSGAPGPAAALGEGLDGLGAPFAQRASAAAVAAAAKVVPADGACTGAGGPSDLERQPPGRGQGVAGTRTPAQAQTPDAAGAEGQPGPASAPAHGQLDADLRNGAGDGFQRPLGTTDASVHPAPPPSARAIGTLGDDAFFRAPGPGHAGPSAASVGASSVPQPATQAVPSRPGGAPNVHAQPGMTAAAALRAAMLRMRMTVLSQSPALALHGAYLAEVARAANGGAAAAAAAAAAAGSDAVAAAGAGAGGGGGAPGPGTLPSGVAAGAGAREGMSRRKAQGRPRRHVRLGPAPPPRQPPPAAAQVPQQASVVLPSAVLHAAEPASPPPATHQPVWQRPGLQEQEEPRMQQQPQPSQPQTAPLQAAVPVPAFAPPTVLQPPSSSPSAQRRPSPAPRLSPSAPQLPPSASSPSAPPPAPAPTHVPQPPIPAERHEQHAVGAWPPAPLPQTQPQPPQPPQPPPLQAQQQQQPPPPPSQKARRGRKPSNHASEAADRAGITFDSLSAMQVWLDAYALRTPDPVPPVLHLGWRVHSGTGRLRGGVLRVRSTVVIKSGRMTGCRVWVENGAAVELHKVDLEDACVDATAAAGMDGGGGGGGQGALLGPAVVTVVGEGSSVLLLKCSVAVPTSGGGASAAMAGCVLAARGGRAELRGCGLAGAPCFGLAAAGGGSIARADETTAQNNGTAGFLALRGGLLEATACVAEFNGSRTGKISRRGAAGVAAGREDASSAGCTVLRTDAGGDIRGSGFVAADGGVVRLYGRCNANKNLYTGFLSWGAGALLTAVDALLRAEHNGWAGFASGEGGRLAAGPRSVAVKNRLAGYAAYSRSTLEAGEGSAAHGNGLEGWLADGGGRVVAGPGCSSAGNASRGMLALDGGRIEVGPGSLAEANGQEGYAAVGGTVVVGRGGRALRNGVDGFTASDGGLLDASAGECVAEGNRQHGFCAEDEGSSLVAGPGCVARGNGGWGARVVGRGAVLRLGPGWRAELNAEDEGLLVEEQ